MKWYAARAIGMAVFVAGCTEGRDSTAPTQRVVLPSAPSPASLGSGAAFTSVNEAVDGPDHCKNGNPTNNCNIYDGKTFVWLNGGPVGAGLDNGTYFFAVLAPGGQPNPNDGSPKLLSTDTRAKRTFSVVDGQGTIVYDAVANGHELNGNQIRLMPYNNTPNPGGVYIMAVCALPAGGGDVDPKSCKYDAFKIVPLGCEAPCGGTGDATIDVAKTIETSWIRTFKWTLDKSATEEKDGISLKPGETGTIHYSVKVTHDAGADAYSYKGTVTVSNTALVNAHVTSIVDDKGPSLTCDTAPPFTLAPGGFVTCTYSETATSSDDIVNTATATFDGANGPVEVEDVKTGSFIKVEADNCTTVTDNYAGSGFPHTVCTADENPTTFYYTRTVGPYNSVSCGDKQVDNTAAITAPASSVGEDKVSVKVSVTGCAQLHVKKFYDANANGVFDGTDVYITGWKVNVAGVTTDVPFTTTDGLTPLNFAVNSIPFGSYNVKEYASLTGSWLRTTPSTQPVPVTLGSGDNKTVTFGNVCLAGGGGLTLGFWSNNNGQAIMKAGDNFASVLAFLTTLNLRNANGTAFDPANYTAFRTWILGANASNMANMLSAQLAAMEMNVRYSKVSGSALVYLAGATGVPGQNAGGFISVNDLMTAANISLGANGNTVAAGPIRTYQEALKTALDQANNNLNFVQSAPCRFSF